MYGILSDHNYVSFSSPKQCNFHVRVAGMDKIDQWLIFWVNHIHPSLHKLVHLTANFRNQLSAFCQIRMYRWIVPHFVLLSRAHRVEKNQLVKNLLVLEKLPKLTPSRGPRCIVCLAQWYVIQLTSGHTLQMVACGLARVWTWQAVKYAAVQIQLA